MARTPSSGTQHALRSGDYQAVIASIGATTRTLTHNGRDLVVPFDADEVRPAFRGATLAPWPNRVVNGRYTFGGVRRQLALTEPSRFHALHGLVAWIDFEAVNKGSDHVTLSAVIQPETAYPWRVNVTTTFSLGPDGLTQSVIARNESSHPAPWGTAPHPYLIAGAGRVNDWKLEIPAATVLTVTPERLVPTDLVPVDRTDVRQYDFRSARPIENVEIDHAFSGLLRDEHGVATVRVTGENGSGVAMSWDSSCPWVQIHTADSPDPLQSRRGLAVEPMTCAPDAFNEAEYSYDAGLITLEPGEETCASWRIAATA